MSVLEVWSHIVAYAGLKLTSLPGWPQTNAYSPASVLQELGMSHYAQPRARVPTPSLREENKNERKSNNILKAGEQMTSHNTFGKT